MLTKDDRTDKPLEFLKIYGTTLLLALAGTFAMKMAPGDAAFSGQPVAEARQVQNFPEAPQIPSVQSLLPMEQLKQFWVKYLP